MEDVQRDRSRSLIVVRLTCYMVRNLLRDCGGDAYEIENLTICGAAPVVGVFLRLCNPFSLRQAGYTSRS